MRLQDELPRHVTVDGRRVRVDLEYRNVLRMIAWLQRDDMMPEAREYKALRCVCRHPRPGLLRALRALLFEDGHGEEAHRRITDFDQDADLIRAAFLQVYGINLWRERLHWFEFSALLTGLPGGSRYAEILSIRTRELPAPTKYNAEERRWLMEAKQKYALRLDESERERNYRKDVGAIAAALLGMAEKKDGEDFA